MIPTTPRRLRRNCSLRRRTPPGADITLDADAYYDLQTVAELSPLPEGGQTLPENDAEAKPKEPEPEEPQPEKKKKANSK